jgi:hypothetical protein
MARSRGWSSEFRAGRKPRTRPPVVRQYLEVGEPHLVRCVCLVCGELAPVRAVEVNTRGVVMHAHCVPCGDFFSMGLVSTERTIS